MIQLGVYVQPSPGDGISKAGQSSVRPSFRSNLNYWLMKTTGHISFDYDPWGVMGIFAYKDNHDITLAKGIPCPTLPSFVWICLIERTVANPMLGLVFGLFVKVILEILVFIKLKTHEYVEDRHTYLQGNSSNDFEPNPSFLNTSHIISA